MEIHSHDVLGSTICADGTPAVDHPNYRCTLVESQLPAIHSARSAGLVSDPSSGGPGGGPGGGGLGDGAAGHVSSTPHPSPYLLRLHHYCLQSYEFFHSVKVSQLNITV